MKTNQTIQKIKNYSKIPVLALAVLLTGCDKDEEDDDVPAEEHDHEMITDVDLIFTNDADPSDVVVVSAVDPDGEGVEELTIEDVINLDTGKTYTLTLEIWNNHDDHDDHDEEGEHEDHDEEGDHEDEVAVAIEGELTNEHEEAIELEGEVLVELEGEHEDDHDDHDEEGEHDDHDEDHGENIGEEIAEEADEHQVFFSFTNDAFSSPSGDGNIDNSSDAINYLDEDSNGYPLGLETSWTTSSVVSDGTFKVVLMHQPDIKSSTSGVNDGDADFELEFKLNIQ